MSNFKVREPSRAFLLYSENSGGSPECIEIRYQQIKRGHTGGLWKPTTFIPEPETDQKYGDEFTFISEDLYENTYRYFIPKWLVEKEPEMLDLTFCYQNTNKNKFGINVKKTNQWVYRVTFPGSNLRNKIQLITLNWGGRVPNSLHDKVGKYVHYLVYVKYVDPRS